MNEQQFENAIWWIDRMALEAAKEYRIWANQTEPMEQEEHFDRLMGRMKEMVETINLIARTKYATAETKAKIVKTVEWLNSHMGRHQIRINMKG